MAVEHARRLGTDESSLKPRARPPIFETALSELDHRAITSGAGTVTLHQKDWQSRVRAD
jgi:hypothetical protein